MEKPPSDVDARQDIKAPLPEPAPPPFTGREALQARIRTRLEETKNGQGGGLALRGKSGLGKTRLAQGAQELAEQIGMQAIFIPCRGSLHRPLHPVEMLVRALLNIGDEEPRASQADQLKRRLSGIDRRDLLPKLNEILGLQLEDEEDGAAAQEKDNPEAAVELPDSPFDLPGLPETLLRLFQGIDHAASGVLVVFDDLDQAHDSAQAALSTLAQELIGHAALLLATFSPDATKSLQEVFSQSVLDLEGLTKPETTALCRPLVEPHAVPDAFVNRLFEHTAGQPLHMIMQIAYLRRTGLLAKGSESQPVDTNIDLLSLADLIVKRYDSLSDSLKSTLRYAAILGSGFRMGALSSLHGKLYSDEVRDSLKTLLKTGWIKEVGKERRASFYFVQRIVEQTLYEQVSAEERIKLHRQAGDYYAVPGIGRRLRTQTAIYHYLKTGDAARAVEVIEIALAQLERADDQALMLDLYRQGAEVAAGDPSLIAQQARMAEGIGDIYARNEAYREAAQAYSNLSPSTSPSSLISKLGLVLLDVDPERATKTLMRVAPAVARSYPNDLYWRVEAGLIWGLAQTNHMYDAIRRSRDILGSLGDTAGFGSARTLIRGTLGMAMHYFDDPVEAHPHLESARAGWGARGSQEGILLINQILIEVPVQAITKHWLRFVLKPVFERDLS